MNVITNNDNKCNLALLSLKDVLDPEIGLNVVDLGLIYRIDFNEDSG
ncbi:MAG TPA: iron-sulfur cluster assembly protein, partial [Hanamia sp.]